MKHNQGKHIVELVIGVTCKSHCSYLKKYLFSKELIMNISIADESTLHQDIKLNSHSAKTRWPTLNVGLDAGKYWKPSFQQAKWHNIVFLVKHPTI